MYPYILILHSCFRWLVLAGLLFSIYRAYTGWLNHKTFSKTDNTIRHVVATIAHIQLIFGLCLYFISPIVKYFLANFSNAVHERSIRFFGMEHSTMMLLSIILITIGSAKAKRAATDTQKFKTIAIWYTIALIIILVNIPWPFSPFASRPFIRFH